MHPIDTFILIHLCKHARARHARGIRIYIYSDCIGRSSFNFFTIFGDIPPLILADAGYVLGHFLALEVQIKVTFYPAKKRNKICIVPLSFG